MPRRANAAQGDLLQGTLDLLVLRSLVLGPAHGHTIAHAIEHGSEHMLQVEHGSLYPALYRLEDRGLIKSFWGTSENNRRRQVLPPHARPAGVSWPPKPAAGSSWCALSAASSPAATK